MRNLITALMLLLPTTGFAGDILCYVQEIDGDTKTNQEIRLEDSDDPHGAFVPFKSSVFPEYNGFVALSNRFIVIHLYNEKTSAAISTQSHGDNNRYSRLQYLMPGSNLDKAIIVECAEQTN
ncbi:MAG: hypothetical protein ACLGGX_06060 [Bdellovibrionia bacterium]